VTDAHVLETKVEETLGNATLLLEVRRKRLWDFRRKNLSVTWGELRQRATKEGQDALSETIGKRLVEITTEALEMEGNDIFQLKRASRYIRLFYRLFGMKRVDRRNNDTDQMMGLLGQLELENELLKELDDVFERAGASIGLICAGAENSSEGRSISWVGTGGENLRAKLVSARGRKRFPVPLSPASSGIPLNTLPKTVRQKRSFCH